MKYLIIVLTAVLLFAAGCSGNKTKESASTGAQNKVVYTCPMHPQVISDKPGVCPICHMDLVIKTSSMDTDTMPMSVDISSSKQILANVSTITIKAESYNKEVRAYSTLDFAEDSRKTIAARFNGRIEKLLVNKTGDYVKKGEALFEIYSPELIQAQNDYVLSLKNDENYTMLSNDNKNSLLAAAREKLLLFGLTESQVDQLEKSNAVNQTLTYYSPYSGTVLEKKVQEGMYVNEGTILFELSDLSTLWNIAEVYESDINSIAAGGRVKLNIASYPGEVFEGKVSFIYPVINPQTRTIKVRSIIPNPKNRLKPNMYGEAYFAGGSRTGITVPLEAVLLTGKRNIVYVKVSAGHFEAREVQVGSRIDGRYEILSGLSSGEEIAASGGYLIDSESQLRGINNNEHKH
ncbi:MAG: efflux RND transporter periplasmic adaptor subunit [Ignavibacteriaceae bacterium]|nr:efflux RND transporter periplasmic adaptor subunit [Ignavibacteriaceae bacterium]